MKSVALIVIGFFVSLVLLPELVSAQSYTCSGSAGEWGYNLETHTSFVKDPIVTESLLVLLQCYSDTEEPLKEIEMTIAIGGYICGTIQQNYPLNPTDYVGYVPNGYHGNMKITAGGASVSASILTPPTRQAGCPGKKRCRRSFSSLTRREMKKLCEYMNASIRPPIVLRPKSNRQ